MIGETIKRIRTAQGISRPVLADRCKLHVNFIAGVENGKHGLTVQSLIKIGAGLGMPAWKILRHVQDPEVILGMEADFERGCRR